MFHAGRRHLRIVLFFISLAVLSPPANADSDEAQVRRDCRLDAVRYCVNTIPASVFFGKREPTEDERNGIIACMLAHRDRLTRKCTKHFW